jgi:hypothetical protein
MNFDKGIVSPHIKSENLNTHQSWFIDDFSTVVQFRWRAFLLRTRRFQCQICIFVTSKALVNVQIARS